MCFPGVFPVTPKIIDLLIRDISLSIELTADLKEDARCGRMQIANEVQISDFTDWCFLILMYLRTLTLCDFDSQGCAVVSRWLLYYEPWQYEDRMLLSGKEGWSYENVLKLFVCFSEGGFHIWWSVGICCWQDSRDQSLRCFHLHLHLHHSLHSLPALCHLLHCQVHEVRIQDVSVINRHQKSFLQVQAQIH